jgi:4-amino-4-deoxy-L-arabinose transferase-like glycosyltransferase
MGRPERRTLLLGWVERLRRRWSLLPSVAALGFAVVVLVRAHLTFFEPLFWPMNFRDEGYITAFARRMIHGHWLPYVDAVSHRGPMLYWVAALAVRIGGAGFGPIRVLALVCSLLVVALVFAASLRARRPLAGALAAVVLAAVLVVELRPDDGLAYNAEPLLDVFALAGLSCLTVGLAPDRRGPSLPWVAAAGALAMLGALTKQVGAVTLAPFAGWVLASSLARPGGRTGLRRTVPLLAFSAGAAAPLLLVLARYAIAGELSTLRYYLFTYNAKVYLAPFDGRAAETIRSWTVYHASWLLLAVVLVVLGLARSLAGATRATFWSTADRNGFLLTVAGCAGVAGAAANASLRDFPHYYLQALPWFALLLGVLVEDYVVPTDASAPRRAILELAILGPAIAITWFMSATKIDGYAKDASYRSTPAICTFVRAHSSPQDSIYVWGFAADIYTFCDRRPASRYVYSTFLSGFVPFFENASPAEDAARVVPGSSAIFLSELAAERPALVIDVPKSMGNRSIMGVPAFADYLKAYCRPTLRDGVAVFARLDPGGTCPTP